MHGNRVVVVTHPGEGAGEAADAAVTGTAGCPVVVRTADCPPVVLLGERSVGVVHAGWRGLRDGVVEQAVAALVDLGDPPRVAHLGPCIRVGCYEFVGPERHEMAALYGSAVLGTTTAGTPGLDLPVAVIAALQAVGVAQVEDTAGCTACDPRWYSHRKRGDAERMATLAWLEHS